MPQKYGGLAGVGRVSPSLEYIFRVREGNIPLAGG